LINSATATGRNQSINWFWTRTKICINQQIDTFVNSI